ncbi:hypothetical protein BX666DRAFT_1994452 [Dichotomocladium elegans]|nr:hypothetical protein BX666DRAFT_1994452 [Dichotomocladium elegans]
MRFSAVTFTSAAAGALICLVSGVHGAPAAVYPGIRTNPSLHTISKREAEVDKDLLRDVVESLSEILEPGLELDDLELDDLVEEVLDGLEVEDIGEESLLTSVIDVVGFALESLLDVISNALDDTISS